MAGQRVVHWVVAALTILAGPLVGEARAQRPSDLVINDTSTAAWMTINNSFVQVPGQPWDRGRQHWDGVLIQLGDYLFDGQPLRDFLAVEFRFASETTRLDRGTFEWINIVADVQGKDAPMEVRHLSLLYPAPNTSSSCDAVDACAVQACVGGSTPLLSCLRSRSLHGFFLPLAVITYWAGPRGYEVSASPASRGGAEFQHRFSFNDAFKVWIKYTGQAEPVLLEGRLRQIVVVDDPDVYHGDYHSPPWEPLPTGKREDASCRACGIHASCSWLSQALGSCCPCRDAPPRRCR